MADAMRGQENSWPGTDPFASRGNVQRTPDGAAGPAQSDFSSGRGATHRNMSAVPGPDFLSSTGTHRNLSAVSHVGGRQGGGDTGCVVRTGAAPVVSSGQGGTGCVVRTGRRLTGRRSTRRRSSTRRSSSRRSSTRRSSASLLHRGMAH